MQTVSMVCPVCDSRKFTLTNSVFDDRYGEPNLYYLARCIKCNHTSTYPRIKNESLKDLYSNYYPRKEINIKTLIKNAKRSATILSPALRWFNGTNNQGQFLAKKGDKLLDFGCGDGTSLLESQSKGVQAFGIETDINVKPIAKELNLNIFFGTEIENAFPGILFDIIVLNQVLEHAPEPLDVLNKLKLKLKPNGFIVVVIPNIESIWQRLSKSKWINWHVPYHLHHFNRENFIFMASRLNLSIKSCKTITPTLWTLLQLSSLKRKSLIGKRNSLWSKNNNANSKQNLIVLRKLFRKILYFVPFFILSLVNRMIDFLSLGDSLMFIMTKDKN